MQNTRNNNIIVMLCMVTEKAQNKHSNKALIYEQSFNGKVYNNKHATTCTRTETTSNL